MASYRELLAKRDALEAEIAHRKQEEMQGVLNSIKQQIEEFGFTPEDLFGRSTRSRVGVRPEGSKRRVEAKYRDPVSGTTWSGRGKPPRWIAGETDRSKFEIK